MNAVFRLVREYGIHLEYSDLGEWGVDELRSEYDPAGPTIRINKHVIENLPMSEIGDFICFAIGHELYHHREYKGEIVRLADKRDREIAANEFARKLIAK
ncbi:MAG: hypothetical protein M3Y21_03915 [Candidatus Eremiobacteraeota bacterium]|nr:hypothetical protein [Candidatus Eremiobacteraeota bacterium]